MQRVGNRLRVSMRFGTSVKPVKSALNVAVNAAIFTTGSCMASLVVLIRIVEIMWKRQGPAFLRGTCACVQEVPKRKNGSSGALIALSHILNSCLFFSDVSSCWLESCLTQTLVGKESNLH